MKMVLSQRFRSQTNPYYLCMSDVREFLENHLQPLAGPYLFVGAGIPRRYVGLPNWRQLLAHFAEKTDMPMGYYESGTLPQAASKLAAVFHEIWWRSGDYSESVNLWESRVAGDIAMPLKIEVSRLVDTMVDEASISDELVEEFELFKAMTVDGILTTNYDSLLSVAFPSYEVFVGQDGLLFSDTQGIAEIYAIHGTSADPRSLILTQEDYDEYAKRNAYLAAKLLTVFVEHPVVFLGYSFNDPNVHTILRSIVDGLQDKAVEKLQDRLIFVEWEAGVEPSAQRTQISVGDYLLPIIRITVPDFAAVYSALGARQRALPARVLRILKEQVYEIVRTNDPTKRLYAYQDIDDEKAKDISIVFGVGAKVATVGIVGLSRPEIWKDLLADPEGGYSPIEILDRLIPSISVTTYYPVFKYLNSAGFLSQDGSLDPSVDLNKRTKMRAKRNVDKLTTAIDGVAKRTFAELESRNDWEWLLNNALELPAYTDDVEGLRVFLLERRVVALNSTWWVSQYAKAAVAYDYMKYGPGRLSL
jgi:hypothetical protein